MTRLMMTVRMMMAQPQLEAMWAWMNWSERKRYLPMRPKKPKSSRGSRVTLPPVAWMALRTLTALGPA